MLDDRLRRPRKGSAVHNITEIYRRALTVTLYQIGACRSHKSRARDAVERIRAIIISLSLHSTTARRRLVSKRIVRLTIEPVQTVSGQRFRPQNSHKSRPRIVLFFFSERKTFSFPFVIIIQTHFYTKFSSKIPRTDPLTIARKSRAQYAYIAYLLHNNILPKRPGLLFGKS